MIVALYARVSTVKQAEKDLSIPDQIGQITGSILAHKIDALISQRMN